MRCVLQRVTRGAVQVDGHTVGAIDNGFVALTGVIDTDTVEDIDLLVEKIRGLRVFDDEEGTMNLSLHDVAGAVLVISQFTLHADCRKGRRPSFNRAAPPEVARPMIDRFIQALRDRGLRVESGRPGLLGGMFESGL